MKQNKPAGLSWEEYTRAPVSQEEFAQCRIACGPALKEQRRLIQHLIEVLHPRQVAFFGSGYLNDIPVEVLFDEERDSYLVDWIPNISEEGLRGSVIHQEDATYHCVFCNCENPTRYCQAFDGDVATPNRVCGAFCPVRQPALCCRNYIPGEQPTFIIQDITAGRAVRFAQRIGKLVPSCQAPEQAFRKAIQECRNCAGVSDVLPIPPNSLDFITSSMVVSQFDNEPYRYFSKLLELKFGREQILRKEKILMPLMKELRAALFKIQVEGHVSEIHRLLNKEHGKVYFSAELFCALPHAEGPAPRVDDYFMVHQMPDALEILSQFFFFDFQLIPPETSLRNTQINEGHSVVQCYALTPKPHLRDA